MSLKPLLDRCQILPAAVLCDCVRGERIGAGRGAPDPAACRADAEAAQPLGHMGTPDEVGQLCLFLAADATFTTGTDNIVSGGAELGYGKKSRRD